MARGETEYVWVYRYRFWDPEKNNVVMSETMATSDAIRSGLGIAVNNTALRVLATDVDDYGRYRVSTKQSAD